MSDVLRWTTTRLSLLLSLLIIIYVKKGLYGGINTIKYIFCQSQNVTEAKTDDTPPCKTNRESNDRMSPEIKRWTWCEVSW